MWSRSVFLGADTPIASVARVWRYINLIITIITIIITASPKFFGTPYLRPNALTYSDIWGSSVFL